MKARKKRTVHKTPEHAEQKPSLRNRAVHIPLNFEKAVEGLLNVKPKKQRRKT